MSGLTTHVLDTGIGRPAEGVSIDVYCLQEGKWSPVGGGETNEDGRVKELLSKDFTLTNGMYRMVFDTKPYFTGQSRKTFYPNVEITFEIESTSSHYHVPLLISGFGYSTYRGS